MTLIEKVFLVLLLIGGGALYGDITVAETRDEANRKTIEEIIVTAERREANIQDMDISMTVKSAEDIKNLRLENSVQLGNSVPNLGMDKLYGETIAPIITMRGVNNADFRFGTPTPSTVYSDDVVLSALASQGFALYDVERIEVLRGPQGTLYGRNSTAGAIRYISARPSQETKGYFRVTAGNHNQTRIEGGIGGALTDDLSARLAVISNDQDGWATNIPDGSKRYNVKQRAARSSFDWQATDAINIYLKINHGEDRSDPAQWRNSRAGPHPFASFFADPSLLFNPGPGSNFEKTNQNGPNKQIVRQTDVNLTVNVDLGELVLTSITGYIDNYFEAHDDADETATTIIHEYYSSTYEAYTQEFRLQNQSSSKFAWTTGVFFMTDETTSVLSNELTDLYTGGLPVTVLGFPEDTGIGLHRDYVLELDSAAAFLHTTYEWNDKLTTTHGIRYSRDEIALDFFYLPCSTFDTSTDDWFFDRSKHQEVTALFGCAPITDISNEKETFSEVTGKLGFEYRYDDDVMLYGHISRGYKTGNFNLATANPAAFNIVDAETVIAYEAGVKSRWLDGRLVLNGAVFYSDYRDFQLFGLVGSTNQGLIASYTNIPESEFYGLELEVQAQVTERLDMSFGLGLVESEVKKYVDAAGRDFSGKELTGATDMDFNGVVRYEVPIGNGVLIPQLDFSYRGESYDQIENTSKVGDYWLVNARLTYEHASGVSVNVFVENIEDEAHVSRSYDPEFGLGNDFATITRPRMYGVTVGYEF